jgi:hypothetical protein
VVFSLEVPDSELTGGSGVVGVLGVEASGVLGTLEDELSVELVSGVLTSDEVISLERSLSTELVSDVTGSLTVGSLTIGCCGTVGFTLEVTLEVLLLGLFDT